MIIIKWIKNKIKRYKYKKFITYYRENPDKFCEDYLGMKLYNYQKKMIKDYFNNSN